MAFNFFKLFQRKASQARIVTTVHQAGRAVNTPRNIDGFTKEGYQKNAIAYKCVSTLARKASQVPWCLYKTGTDKEIESHEILDLLARPNPMQGTQAFFEALYAYFLITGNTFMEGVSVKEKQVNELWTQSPKNWTIIPGTLGLPAFYEVKGSQRTVRFPVNPVNGQSYVMHVKTFNPDPADPWWGMSPISAAVYSVDIHNSANQWNFSLLEHYAQPSGILTIESTDANPTGTLPEPQFINLKNDIDKNYSGSQNAGRPMLLEGGVKWSQTSFNPKDMEWLNSKNTSAREIALVFGVPPLILNISGDNTYANMKEAKLALVEDAVLPLISLFRTELNRYFQAIYGNEIELREDLEAVPELLEKRTELYDKMNALSYLTINEKRMVLGYPKYEPSKEEMPTGADTLFAKSGDVPLETIFSAPAEDVSDDLDPDDVPDGDKPNGEEDDDGSGDKPEDGSEEDSDDVEDSGKKPTDEDVGSEESDNEDGKDKSVVHFQNIKQINITGQRAKQRTARQLNAQRDRLGKAFELDLAEDLGRIAQKMSKAVTTTDLRLAEFAVLKALGDEKDSLKRTLEKHIGRALRYFGGNILESGKSFAPNETKSTTKYEEFVKSFIESRSAKAVSEIESTSAKKARRIIRDILSEAVENGDSVGEVQKALREEFDGLTPGRAQTIARTEMGIASNHGSLEAAKALEVPDLMKEWVSVNDDRTRDDPSHADHVVMNGVKEELSTKFFVPPDAQMDGPGDPSAPAEQVINCRCTLVYARAPKAGV